MRDTVKEAEAALFFSKVFEETKLGDMYAEEARRKIGQIEVPPVAPYRGKAARPAFRFVAAGDLEVKPTEFLVADLVETETLGLLFGDPGCGKSFLAVDLALSVATGTEFHGHPTRQGSVFYIAGEGHNGLVRRFHAWARRRGQQLDDVPLFKSERAAQFLDGASAKAVAGAVGDLAKDHGAPALIIIDTVARNFGAGDENSTQDMSNFVAAMDDLKACYPGSVILLVHHSGHSEKQRARGAMALKGALDFEYRLEKDVELTLSNTKMKDAEPPADLFFRLERVDIGNGISSAALSGCDAPERSRKVSPAQRLALETYEAAAVHAGEWDGGAFLGVHVEAWREVFYSKHTGDSADAKRKAFQRVRSDLVGSGVFDVTDDVYLIKDGAMQVAIMSRCPSI